MKPERWQQLEMVFHSALEQAYAAHDLQLQYLGIEEGFDSLRGDSRFLDLVRRVDLTP